MSQDIVRHISPHFFSAFPFFGAIIENNCHFDESFLQHLQASDDVGSDSVHVPKPARCSRFRQEEPDNQKGRPQKLLSVGYQLPAIPISKLVSNWGSLQ